MTDSATKIDRLHRFLPIRNPDSLILTEHGFEPTAIENVSLFNYTLITSYCRENHLKGGTAIYKHNKLANEIEMANIEGHSIELVCEMAGIKISIGKNKRLYVLGVYRPPAAQLEMLSHCWLMH